MPEDSKESKAQKLAAARKKLKEFQTKDRHLETSWPTSEQGNFASGTTSATMSEKSDSELNLNEQCSERGADIPPVETTETIGAVQDAKTFLSTPVNVADSTAPPCAAYGTAASTEADPRQDETVVASDTFKTCSVPPKETQQTVNTLQLLICEKTQLNTELNKYRTLCREGDLENEELHTQLIATTRRLEELQQRYLEQQNAMEELHSSAASGKQQLTQSEAKISDQVAHINELQQQLTKIQTQNHEFEELYKQKSNELEMAQIRINQLSDESCITNDSRVESLTQTQFMYEQQIRDLQAMVQQLTQDKEQANLQYQNYAQHLNAEISNLNEKNSEISDECARLRDREQQLVQHISSLEREIQRNILRHDQIKEDSSLPTEKEIKLEQEIAEFKEKVSNFEISQHEFQLKIKSQEDHLDAYTKELQQKQQEIALLQEHLQNVTSEQPDKTKLLATMESDKIAASRAVTQNVELKKQLNELEQRFVQLTNDKADLMNKLDAEEHANREMRATYLQMEEKLHSIDERFKFKDEEMIRLSHENMDLTRTNLMLRQQLDRLKRYEIRKYSERYAKDNKVDPEFQNSDNHDHNDQDHQQYDEHNGHKGDHGNEKNHVNNRTHNHEHDHGTHSHDHNNKNQGDNHDHQDDNNDHQDKNNDHHDCNHEHEIDYVSDHKHSDNHEHFHVSNRTSQSESESASCHEAGEDLHFDQCDHICSQHDPHILPMTQAVEKLQQRFTQLMSQVADLTEEKQRLEHLVLQLQGETETIGEYIALYQNQRRVLKQREYEKAAQMQLLQTEREQLREKIAILNNLVSSLGAELPNNALLAEHFSNATTAQAQSVCIEPILESEQHSSSVQQLEMPANKLDSNESQKILTKIQSIISEIKEDTKEVPTVTHTVDHFNCCLGKFEVV